MLEKKITVPEDFAGPEWSGEYTIKTISSLQRDEIDEKVTKVEYNEDADRWVPKVNESEWRRLIILATVENKKVSERTYDEIPSKLRDVLWDIARGLNYASLREVRFLQSKSTTRDQTSESSNTSTR